MLYDGSGLVVVSELGFGIKSMMGLEFELGFVLKFMMGGSVRNIPKVT